MYRTLEQLNEGLPEIRQSPADNGRLDLIVSRPEVGERIELVEAELDSVEGLVGDNWLRRGNSRTGAGTAHPDTQINIMNARAAALLAGDQLYEDLDLSRENLPPGTRLAVGSAVVEVTAEPHLGCAKFKHRFGRDAVLFVNSNLGKALNLRGINARVVSPGKVRRGDPVRKIPGTVLAGTSGS